MSGEQQSLQSQEFHTPGWHYEARTPVVDGKYLDRKTGEILVASGHEEFKGPPAVDVIINSLHADTTHCGIRAALPFPMETLLCHITQIVADRKLQLDSLVATTYTIRVVLAHELTVDEFNEVSVKMALGIWH